MNNFQKLYETDQERFEEVNQRVLHNLEQNRGMFKFIGEVVELYFPFLLDFFVKMAGGTETKIKSNDSRSNIQPNSNDSKYPNKD